MLNDEAISKEKNPQVQEKGSQTKNREQRIEMKQRGRNLPDYKGEHILPHGSA